MADKKPRGYWQSLENAKNEAYDIMGQENLDYLPGGSELIKSGHYGFLAGVNKYHGGMVAFRKIINLNKKDSRKFRNLEEAVSRAKEIMGDLGVDKLPSSEYLAKNGYSDLWTYINNYGGGFIKFRQILGETDLNKEKGYWKDPENILYETKIFLNKFKLKEIPPCKEMRKLGYSSLSAAQNKYPGGIRKLRIDLGEKLMVQPANHWKNWNNVKSVLLRLSKRLGHFPSETELRESEYKSLPSIIRKYHGGINKVQEKLGYSPKITERGYWQDINRVRSVLNDLEDKLGHFPTSGEIRTNGYRSMLTGIQVYHGGLRELAKKLNKKVIRKEDNYWKQWGNVELQINEIIKELGHFPSSSEIKSNSLKQAITNYHGGFYKVEEKMGYKSSLKKINGYWKDFENIEKVVKELVEKLGHFPKEKEFRENKYSSVAAAIHQHHGGFTKVRERMGYSSACEGNPLENLLERYAGGENGN
jgi:hypothetical protein